MLVPFRIDGSKRSIVGGANASGTPSPLTSATSACAGAATVPSSSSTHPWLVLRIQETLSRAKKNSTLSFKTVEQLAQIVGLKLKLVEDNPITDRIQEGTLFPS